MSNTKSIDYTKCDKCNGNYCCVRDCVTKCLSVSETNENYGYPEFVHRGICIDCGHCIAICHRDAFIKHNCILDSECSDDVFMNYLSTKRTVRSYSQKKLISKEMLDIILLAGQSAPTQKNRKTVRICVVKEALKTFYLEALETMKDYVVKVGERHPQYKYILELYNNKSPVFWGAEYCIVVIGKAQFSVDAAIASERMQLMAHIHEIASGYNGNIVYAINNNACIREMLLMKKDEIAHVAFALGYSDLDYKNPYISKKKDVAYF